MDHRKGNPHYLQKWVIGSKAFSALRGPFGVKFKAVTSNNDTFFLLISPANTICVQGTALNTGNTALKTTDEDPCLMLLIVSRGKEDI